MTTRASEDLGINFSNRGVQSPSPKDPSAPGPSVVKSQFRSGQRFGVGPIQKTVSTSRLSGLVVLRPYHCPLRLLGIRIYLFRREVTVRQQMVK